MTKLPAYDGGESARQAHARALSRLTPPTTAPPVPTAAQLERHAARFGPGQVVETAAGLDVSVVIPRERRAPKRGGPSLKERVASLVADGHGVEVIAEVEDMSPARARRLIAEVEQ